MSGSSEKLVAVLGTQLLHAIHSARHYDEHREEAHYRVVSVNDRIATPLYVWFDMMVCYMVRSFDGRSVWTWGSARWWERVFGFAGFI